MKTWRLLALSCAVVASFAAAGSAFANNALGGSSSPVEAPVPLPTDDKIVSFTYSADAIYTVLTEVGDGTHIQLQSGEGIVEKPVLGDTIQWRVSGGPTNLYVKPVRAGLATTMTVVTNRRTYEFDLVSSPTGGKFYQKVFFDYPDDDQATLLRAQDQAQSFIAEKHRLEDQVISGPSDPTAYHYGYTVTGSAAFKPLEVLDDGHQTFIRMPDVQDLPALFLQDDDKKLQLVDYHIRSHNFMVMDRVADRFVLKLNDEEVTVVSDRAKKHWWSVTGSRSADNN